MSEVDILDQIIVFVQRQMPGVPVSDRLPAAGDLFNEMPCICIDLLPGEQINTAWGGDSPTVVRDGMPLDVEVLAGSRAEAFEISTRLRRVLLQLLHIEPVGVDTIDVPMLTPRDDINPHVRSLGAVVDMTRRD